MYANVSHRRVRDNAFVLTIIALLIAFAVVGFITPLAGDDWTWASSEGMQRLHNWFAGYNGRYLGNIIEILITRSVILKTLVYSFSSTGLVVLIVGLAASEENRQPWLYLLTAGLILSISVPVFSQTFGWFAGYVNYVIGFLPPLYALYWIRNRTRKEYSGTHRLFEFGILVVAGLSSSLFVEHITLYSILLGIGLVVYTFVTRRDVIAQSITYLVTTIIGAVLMFTNSGYAAILNGTYSQANRGATVDESIIDKIVNVYSGNMYKFLFQQNGVLLLVLSFALIYVMFRERDGKLDLLKYIIGAILLAYALFASVIRNLFIPSNFDTQLVSNGLAWFSIVFVVAIACGILLISDGSLKLALLFDVASAIMLTAPFVLITPYGPRCEFSSIMFMVIAVVRMLSAAAEDGTLNGVFKKVGAIFGAVVLVFVMSISIANGVTSIKRINYAQTQTDASRVRLHALPFSQYTWDSSPTVQRKKQHRMFKKYVGIKSSTEVRFLPFQVKNGK